jgi:phosphoserine phosphatase RsbU/P
MWSPTKSLVWRLSILILGGAGLVLAAVLLSSHIAQSHELIEQQKQQGDIITLAAVNRINELLGRVQTLAQSSAQNLGFEAIAPMQNQWQASDNSPSVPAPQIPGQSRRAPARYDSQNVTKNLFFSILEMNPDISGMTLAFAPGNESREFSLLHAYRSDDRIKTDISGDCGAEYMKDWYYLPEYLKKPVWVEPYYDQQSGETMVTYAVPIFDESGNLRAVVACELSLQGIRDMLDSLPLGSSGTATLLSSQGVYISHPVRDYEMRQTMYGMAETLGGDPRKPLQSLLDLSKTLRSGETGMTIYRVSSDDVPSYIFYRPIPLTGWSLSVTIPEDQILAPLRKQNETNLIIGLCGGVLLLLSSIWVAFSMTRPLHILASAAGRLATGDFDAPLPKTTRRDEIGRLTASFAKMREDLHSYIEELTTTTAAKEKIASELAIAHQIQLGIVPKLFPPFPNRKDIDLYAMLEPAREVGGDLYDFSLLDEDHLYVAIGDVSGKGVPASLLMAVGKTLLKSTIHSVRDPASALTIVNNELSADNDSCMFITAFCGILNIRSGHFTFANAGHNPPLVILPDGNAKFVRTKPGPALGALQNIRYLNMDVAFENGEMLILYTDGVTEAMNGASEMFGEQGLLDTSVKFSRESAQNLVKRIVEAVYAHANGADQSDDITLLAVRTVNMNRNSPVEVPARQPDADIQLENKREELEKLVTWLEASAETLPLDPALTMSLNLILEEWFINVVSYAYLDKDSHKIAIRLWKQPDDLILQIEDDGQPFDPTAQAEPDTHLDLDKRKIGGLGIHFIRKNTSFMGYNRKDGRNILTLVKSLHQATPSA